MIIKKKKDNLFNVVVPDIIAFGRFELTPKEYFSSNSLVKQIVIVEIV
ncbi:MAG: hypothetical protein VX810_03265 [Bacteroidota bacterium]|nr:hypothetical protein [Bacteroidota bacterium]|tara:strand:- start:187 stop:330 length:144 start_codon:yes stop_codon:yes gene_type:complete